MPSFSSIGSIVDSCATKTDSSSISYAPEINDLEIPIEELRVLQECFIPRCWNWCMKRKQEKAQMGQVTMSPFLMHGDLYEVDTKMTAKEAYLC